MKQRRRAIVPRLGSRPLGDDTWTDPRNQVEKINGYLAPVRWVEKLPKASRFLNYKGDQSHLIGKHLGPNTTGEFYTVVSFVVTEPAGQTRPTETRVGLAYGVYKVREPANA